MKTQMKCRIMKKRVYTVCYHNGKKDIQAKKRFFNLNLTPLDMYNGTSQVYCVKREGKIPY